MVTVKISNNQSILVPWAKGMNAQDALEKSYPSISFGLTYFGKFGYMVGMLNGIYDDSDSGMYWEFFLNGIASGVGIDSCILKDEDTISFMNVPYSNVSHKGSLIEMKHQRLIGL